MAPRTQDDPFSLGGTGPWGDLDSRGTEPLHHPFGQPGAGLGWRCLVVFERGTARGPTAVSDPESLVETLHLALNTSP